MTRFDVWWKAQGYETGTKAYIFSEKVWNAAIKSKLATDSTIPFKAILEIINTTLDKKYTLTQDLKNIIQARWREGMTEKDFENVCKIKREQWQSDPAMRPYLRYETLFSNKMNSYNNEAPPKRTTPEWL